MSRPDAVGTPTKVQVSLYVLDIISINSARRNFNTGFVLRLRWKDQRLVDVGSRFVFNKIWNPKLGILNEREVDASFEKSVVYK